jgi:hypothetical protein
VGSFWIDLQLDIWKELGEAIQTRLQQISSGRKLIENIDPGREVVLAELTDTAYRIGLRHGLQRPFLDVELELYLALNRIVERLPPRHAAADRLWRQRPGWKS